MNKKEERLKRVNEFIKTIADCGRRFFYYCDKDRYTYACFWRSDRGHIYYDDEYTLKSIYVSSPRHKWKNFSHGGTLKDLIKKLTHFIRSGQKLNKAFFNDHWAYKNDIKIVINKGIELEIIE